jgi:arginase
MGKVTLIALPYDSGRFNERMGRGPVELIESRIPDRLREQGHDVEVVSLRLPDGFQTEASALVELQKLGTAAVRNVITSNRRPLLLSGNCGPAALSALSALGPEKTGVIWFDAHGDFNTPETSASGFLDGMSLALATGRCWPALVKRFDGFVATPERNVLLVGARDFDKAESRLLGNSAITQIRPIELNRLEEAMQTLTRHVQTFYVHVDVDVLDESEGRANSYACSGGLSAGDLCAALQLIRRFGNILVSSITAYDPASDHGGGIRSAIDGVAAILIA